MAEAGGGGDTDAVARRLFDQLDWKGEGRLSAVDIELAMRTMGLDNGSEEVIAQLVSGSNDGWVDFERFAECFRRTRASKQQDNSRGAAETDDESVASSSPRSHSSSPRHWWDGGSGSSGESGGERGEDDPIPRLSRGPVKYAFLEPRAQRSWKKVQMARKAGAALSSRGGQQANGASGVRSAGARILEQPEDEDDVIASLRESQLRLLRSERRRVAADEHIRRLSAEKEQLTAQNEALAAQLARRRREHRSALEGLQVPSAERCSPPHPRAALAPFHSCTRPA